MAIKVKKSVKEKRVKAERRSDEALQEAQKMRERLTKGERNGGSASFDILGQGRNVRRYLPPFGTNKLPCVERVVHRRIGPAQKDIMCIGTTCRVCAEEAREIAKVNRKYQRGSEEGKKAWKACKDKYGKTTRYFWLVLPYEGKKMVLPPTIKVQEVGTMVQNLLIEEYADVDNGSDFTDPETGRPLVIIRRGEELNTRYTMQRTDSPLRLKCWPRIAKQVKNFDIDAVIAERYPKLSPKEQMALLDGDDAADDEESDDLAARVARKRAKREKMRLRENRVEKPSKLASKLAGKAKKRHF